MKTLDDIKSSWKEDCLIVNNKIREEIVRTPILHSKYLDMLIECKNEYRTVEIECIKLHRILSRYYRGEFTKQELIDLKRDQWQGVKPIKSELEQLISTDDLMIELQTKLGHYKICLDSLESILKTISSRSYDLRALLDAEKFYSGG